MRGKMNPNLYGDHAEQDCPDLQDNNPIGPNTRANKVRPVNSTLEASISPEPATILLKGPATGDNNGPPSVYKAACCPSKDNSSTCPKKDTGVPGPSEDLGTQPDIGQPTKESSSSNNDSFSNGQNVNQTKPSVILGQISTTLASSNLDNQGLSSVITLLLMLSKMSRKVFFACRVVDLWQPEYKKMLNPNLDGLFPPELVFIFFSKYPSLVYNPDLSEEQNTFIKHLANGLDFEMTAKAMQTDSWRIKYLRQQIKEVYEVNNSLSAVYRHLEQTDSLKDFSGTTGLWD
jgi:hypothetical protein